MRSSRHILGTLSINLKTAKTLGLTVPRPMLTCSAERGPSPIVAAAGGSRFDPLGETNILSVEPDSNRPSRAHGSTPLRRRSQNALGVVGAAREPAADADDGDVRASTAVPLRREPCEAAATGVAAQEEVTA